MAPASGSHVDSNASRQGIRSPPNSAAHISHLRLATDGSSPKDSFPAAQQLAQSISSTETLEAAVTEGAQLEEAPNLLDSAQSTEHAPVSILEAATKIACDKTAAHSAKLAVLRVFSESFEQAAKQFTSVQTLLNKGADVNAQGGRYGNALQAASTQGHEKVVQTLLDKGADVNIQGGEDGNALQAASLEGHEKVVQMLLEKGADVNSQSERHGNAFQAALCGGHEKVAQMLLENGADVNAQGGEYGADVNAKDGNALRCFIWGHEKVVQMLLENGANVNTQSERYGNALGCFT
ncbi:ankyrin repeats (many copies) domain-containing protein [Hirsutella rhossiliensis]|uniref:Ankyrin repeats (Many copies) domain-containing protein n=1 Tax=Hirsutella rhossiliensis TaxID=111463 RepID=A0A9P8MMZ7_9HYPO|nr:ankyrin repeats (many copies) domain-containing protein [Hirsutella rhossiliensis]KAH0956966.1 ankyrin repeats (many copies) domain-containing protein [Hirsutella rhossiliensis]